MLPRLAAAPLVVLLLAAGLAAPDGGLASGARPRVVGGQGVGNPGWVAFLRIHFANGDTGLCGGELIARSWLLTAAHCVTEDADGQPVAPGAVEAFVGLDRMSEASAATASAVDRIAVNPRYARDSSFGDIAVVHLAAPSPRDPVALAPASSPATGTVPFVLGWGVTNSFTAQTSDTLQQVDAPVLDAARCAGHASFDTGSEICAGGNAGRDSCDGDSGGPLAFNATAATAELVGTVDYGPSLCANGQPAVYQRVASGPGADFLAATVPTAQVSLSSTTPHRGTTVTGTASATGFAAPEFSWDLDGDGRFGDASGAQVAIPVGVDPVSVGVVATGEGEAAKRRSAIVPVFGSVAVTAPARVREGNDLVLALARTGTGTSTVTATATGLGVGRGTRAAAVTVPDAASLSLATTDDRTWRASRTAAVRLTATGDLQLATAPSVTVQVLDDDRPVVRVVRVRRTAARTLSVTVKLPGAGTATVSAVKGSARLARTTTRAARGGQATARVRLSAASVRRLRGTAPSLRISWRSSAQRSATARATARGLPLRLR